MAELEEPGKGTTSYAFSSKGKQNEGKSKIKPAPIELSQTDSSREKYKEREKDHEKELTITRKGTKIGHRRINEDGQITYKKQPSSALVSAIQLGIQYSVGRLSSKPERDVLMGDFYEIESVFFPSNGHQETPAHHYSDFRFKAYGPVAFRYFRELFHIAPDDFLISLCHDALVELTNPGASGSLFYLSMDDQFIIKTVQHKEAEFLQKLLPGYYLNLNQNKRTLLPKFFGLYCYQCGGKNIRLVVMNNLLPSGYKFHLKYDLKGSTFKRKASKAERAKSSPTLKDLDFMNDFPAGISVDADTYNALIKTIQRDCRVLESFKIMDYSLLLAIHNVDEAAREEREAQGEPSTARTKPTGAVATTKNTNEARQPSEKSTNELAKDAQASAVVTRNPSGRNRDDFAAYWEAIPQDRHDETPYGAVRARNAKGDRLFLFIGIIDILQSYRLKKRLEHGLKSVVQDGDSISVHRPSFYSRRFQEFMSEKVFRKIPDSKSQITRSPSKKRASFNTGKGRERIRTSSDTDKHGNKSGEHGTKPKHSPSLDAGLANVPGDVSFMGRETKSLENVVTTQKQTNSKAEDKTKNSDDVPQKSVHSTENPDNNPSAPQLNSVSDGERPAEATRTLESSNSAEPNLEHNTEKPDDSPKNVGTSSVSDGETPTEGKIGLEFSNSGKPNPEHSPEVPDDSPKNVGTSSVNDGETPTEGKTGLESSNSTKPNPEHSLEEPDALPNNVGTSSESEDKKLPEVSEKERIDSFSDSETLTEDSRI